MRFDIERFQNDLAVERNDRLTKPNQGGRQLTRAMAAIRKLSPEINKQRALGFTWSQIAAGLAAQGVSQISRGERIPITGRRVSALVDSIRRQDDRRRRSEELRAKRSDRPLEDISDVAMPNVQIPTKRSLRLSADLDSGAMPAASDPTTNITELALRRSALEGIKDLLKKDVT